MIIFYSFANYLCWGQIFVSCISCDNFGEISNFKFTMAAVNGTTCSASVLKRYENETDFAAINCIRVSKQARIY